MSLSASLRALADAVDHGEVPAAAQQRLAAALDHAGICGARDSALRYAAELVATESMSRWQRAGTLADALRRFEATAWPRIRDGHRVARGGLEEALATALRCPLDLPRTQRRLYDVL